MDLPCRRHGSADLRPPRRPLPPATARAVPCRRHLVMNLVTNMMNTRSPACRPRAGRSDIPFYGSFRSYRSRAWAHRCMPPAPHCERPCKAPGPVPDRGLPDLSGVFKWCLQVINAPGGNARCPCAALHRQCCPPCRISSRPPCRPGGPAAGACGRRCLKASQGGHCRRDWKRQGSRTAEIAAVHARPGRLLRSRIPGHPQDSRVAPREDPRREGPVSAPRRRPDHGAAGHVPRRGRPLVQRQASKG